MPRIDGRHALTWSLLGAISAVVFTFTPLNPQPWEIVGWLAIYAVWFVALLRRRPDAPVAQALATSVLSGVWVALVQNAFFTTYLANHPELGAEYGKLGGDAIRIAMISATALGFGLVLGAILGLAVRWRLGHGVSA